MQTKTLTLIVLLTLGLGGAIHAAPLLTIAEDDFSYDDGTLVGEGSGGDAGWAQAWREAFSNGGSATVSSGSVSVDSPYRAARNLDNVIGDADDDGLTYQISIDLEFTNGTNIFNAFEALDAGDGGSDRTIALRSNDGDQSLLLNEASGSATNINFTDQTGINSYLIEIVFGATAGDQDTAELLINTVSQGAPVNIGTGFRFDRVALAAFKAGDPTPGASSLTHADNLNIAVVIPTPAALPAGLVMLGLVVARRRR